MGAVESSSLESIGSLSASLERIEEKLTKIEDTHLHHEAQLCHDDIVIICDKRIVCRPNVRLVLGPILGLVTTSTVNVMVEVDNSCELAFYVFEMSPLVQEGRFSHVKSINANCFEPIVVNIENLSAGCRYAIYVGGVQPNDTLREYAIFETFPEDPQSHKIMFTHDSQADRVLPGEENLWSQLEASVSKRTLGEHAMDRDASVYNHYMPVTDDVHKGDISGVHLAVHLGNFVSIDRYLRKAAVQLVHEICNDDVAVDVWKDHLLRIEANVRDGYRQALSRNPSVRRALRLTGHVVLCGPSEAGGPGLDDLFSAFLMSTQSHSTEEEEGKQVEDVEHVNSIDHEARAAKGTDSESVGEAARVDRERKFRYTVRLTRDQRQVMKLVQGMLLRLARRVQTAYLRQLWDDKYSEFKTYDDMENERHFLMLQALKAVQGKRHLRLRMEKSFKILSERNEDSKDHEALTRFKGDLAKLEKEVVDLENQLTSVYEEGAVATEKHKSAMLRPVVLLSLGGESLLILSDSLWSELILPSGMPASAPLGDNDSKPPPVEVEFDSEFYDQLGVLLAEDRSRLFQSKSEGPEGAQNEKDYDVTPQDVAESSPPLISNVFVVSVYNFVSASVDAYDPGPSFFHGHCLSAALGARVPQSGALTSTDRLALLDKISAWKESQSDKRRCLVVSATSADQLVSATAGGRLSRAFSAGWTMSYAEGLRFGHENSGRGEMKAKAEARLQYLLVSGMSSRRGVNVDNCSPGSALYQEAVLLSALAEGEEDMDSDRAELRKSCIDEEWRETSHLGAVRSLSSPDENGFVIVTCDDYLDTPPITSPSSMSRLDDNKTSLLIDPPTKQFHATCITSNRISGTLLSASGLNKQSGSMSSLQVLLGPVIGAVTPTSVRVVCEYFAARESVATVRLVDQVTGVEYFCRKNILSCQPTVFAFHNLTENRSYMVQALLPSWCQDDIPIMDKSIVSVTPSNMSTRLMIELSHTGSFTTPCSIPPHVIAREWHRQTLQRMRGRSSHHGMDQISAMAVMDVASSFVSSVLLSCGKSAAQKFFDEVKVQEDRRDSNSVDKAESMDRSEGKHDPSLLPPEARHSESTRHGNLESSAELYLQQKLSSRRIIVMGPNQPSWRKHISEGKFNGDLDAFAQEQPHNQHYNRYDADLERLVSGDALCRAVAQMQYESWSGLDLVIHCGGSVDIASALQDVLSTLARAERLRRSDRGYERDESNNLLLLAENQLRETYRLHWNVAQSVDVRHGSQLFCCSSALVDLLSATHYSSLENLVNDTSHFCVENLLRILNKLEQEYQGVLWNSGQFLGSSSAHFLDSGAVCIFQLTPRLSLGMDFLSSDTLHLDPEQLNDLRRVLKEGTVSDQIAAPSARGSINGLPHQVPLTSLIILSPIQLLYPTHKEKHHTVEFSSHCLRYANGVVQELLDVITDWMCCSGLSDDKEVVLVCPSTSACGQRIKVKGYLPDHMNVYLGGDSDPLAPFVGVRPDVEFTQLSCGPTVSAAVPSISLSSPNYQVDQATYEKASLLEGVGDAPEPKVDSEGVAHAEETAESSLFEEGQYQHHEHTLHEDSTRNENQVTVSEEHIYSAEGVDHSYVPDDVAFSYPVYTNKGRVFLSEMVEVVAEPHCGMLCVGGDVPARRNSTSSQDFGEEASSILKLEDVFDLEIYLSNTDQYRIPTAVQDSFHYVANILANGVTESHSVEVRTIHMAALEVCKRCRGHIDRCFGLFEKGVFGGGVMYNSLKNSMLNFQHNVPTMKCNSGIIAMLSNIFRWILKELPNGMRSMFPEPSAFLLKQFWIFFTDTRCGHLYAHIGQDRDTTVSLQEIVLLNLQSELSLFASLCSDGLLCLALFIQVAEEHGVSDLGWQ